MKREDHIGPTWSFKNAMGATLSLDVPANAEQRREDARGLGGRPAAHAAMKDTFSKWGVSPTVPERDSGELRKALEEVFRRRDDESPNPTPYQSLLEDLSRHELEHTRLPLTSRYRNPADIDDTRLHAGEVAAHVLGNPGGEEYRAGLLAFISSVTNELIERGKFEVVHDAALAARSYSALDTQSDQTHRAATAFLGEFGQRSRIDRILDHARKGRKLTGAAVSLLALGKSNALDATLDMLADTEGDELDETLIELALECGDDAIDDTLEARAEKSWKALRPVLAMLRRLPAESALPRFELLLAHSDMRVRRETLLALREVDRRPNLFARHLRRALGDGDLRMIGLCLRCLGDMNGPAAIQLLGSCVEARFPKLAALNGFRIRAATLLNDKGDAGVEQLCKSLDFLRRSRHPRNVVVARGVADLLAPRVDRPIVRAGLRRWKRSLVRLVGLFVPRRRSRTEQAA